MLRGLGRLGLRGELETETLRHLVRSPRTIAELVELICDADSQSPEYHAHYVKIWRGIRELEGRGLVSAPVLGKQKTYRITNHGLGVLLRLRQKPSPRLGVFSRTDMALFFMTLAAGFLEVFSRNSSWIPYLAWLSSLFLLLVGASSYRIIGAITDVW